jgi:hypothetical protein
LRYACYSEFIDYVFLVTSSGFGFHTDKITFKQIVFVFERKKMNVLFVFTQRAVNLMKKRKKPREKNIKKTSTSSSSSLLLFIIVVVHSVNKIEVLLGLFFDITVVFAFNNNI